MNLNKSLKYWMLCSEIFYLHLNILISTVYLKIKKESKNSEEQSVSWNLVWLMLLRGILAYYSMRLIFFSFPRKQQHY